MKKQLSSIGLHYLSKELEVLIDSRVDKIYQPNKNTLIFIFYKTNAGRRILKVIAGKTLFLMESKEENYATLGFGMFLRKHIDRYFLAGIGQINSERIARLDFKSKDEKKILYIEFFGKGNAILCNEDGIIINSLEHQEFKDREIKPKIKYIHPMMQCNFFDMGKNELIHLFKNSRKDSLVTSLAVELGLGGIYAEECCLLSNVDKNKYSKEIDDAEIDMILSSIKSMLAKKLKPIVILKSGMAVDAAPFELEFYKGNEKKEFNTFSEALAFFYSQFNEVKYTEFDRKLNELARIIDEQKRAIEELKKEEGEAREKGELIYHKYSLVEEILDEVNKASKKYSWREIKEKLKGNELIKEVNERERKIVVEI